MKITSMSSSMKCDEAIKCVFNLNSLDLNVYKKLKQLGPVRANELANHLNRERSTVYRSLQKLSKCGICSKKTKTLDHGGYYHEYQCNPIDTIQEQAKHCLDDWYSTVSKTLNQLKD